MRTITIKVTSEDGKLSAQETFSVDPLLRLNPEWIECFVSDLHHRLDILERDGPWKPQFSTVEQSEETHPQKEI